MHIFNTVLFNISSPCTFLCGLRGPCSLWLHVVSRASFCLSFYNTLAQWNIIVSCSVLSYVAALLPCKKKKKKVFKFYMFNTQKYRNAKLHIYLKKPALVSTNPQNLRYRIGSEKIVSLQPYLKHYLPRSLPCRNCSSNRGLILLFFLRSSNFFWIFLDLFLFRVSSSSVVWIDKSNDN